MTVIDSAGKPLDEATRAFMEPRLGHDFSRVRVHTDARAAESARAVHAQAYTSGECPQLSSMQCSCYQPHTAVGRRLLAHELTHVVQQASAASNGTKILQMGSTDDPSEAQAETVARSIDRVPSVGEGKDESAGKTLRRSSLRSIRRASSPKARSLRNGALLIRYGPCCSGKRPTMASQLQQQMATTRQPTPMVRTLWTCPTPIAIKSEPLSSDGKVPGLPNDVPLTDDLENDAAVIGEYFFCKAMNVQPIVPYDSFCATTGLIQGVPFFDDYAERVIEPVLRNLLLTSDEAANLLFSEEDLADFQRLMALGVLPTLPDPTKLVGNSETDVQALGEFFFCRAMVSQPIEPYDRFCLVPGLIQGVPFFTKYVNTVIRPAYWTIPEEVRKTVETRARILKAIETGALIVPGAPTRDQLTEAPAVGAVAPTPELLDAVGVLSAAAILRVTRVAIGHRSILPSLVWIRPKGGFIRRGERSISAFTRVSISTSSIRTKRFPASSPF